MEMARVYEEKKTHPFLTTCLVKTPTRCELSKSPLWAAPTYEEKHSRRFPTACLELKATPRCELPRNPLS